MKAIEFYKSYISANLVPPLIVQKAFGSEELKQLVMGEFIGY